MPDKHAVLSASSCYRWLACPPSAKECAKLPDTSSEFARQGTDAHTLCEFKVKTALGQKLENPTKGLTFFDEEMAAKGEGEYKAGDHCRFCKIKATCRKRAEYNLELVRYDFAVPSTLQDEEIEAVLERADELVNWAGDVKEYALQQALSGKQWDGWKLVEGRSNRRYVNEEAVAEAVEKAGFNPYEKKLLGITAMTKQLGKKRFEELLSDLVEKPQGKPVLVPASDKRPAMYTAADEFNDEK